jgi:hypothetical protein
MGAFKTLTSKDFIIAPLELNKGFRFEGGDALISSSVEIDRFLGGESSTNESTGYLLSISQSAVYHSIKQLYYSNYISGSNGNVQIAFTQSQNPDGTFEGLIPSNAYFNYEPSNLDPKRYFPTGSYITYQLEDEGVYGEALYDIDSYSSLTISPKIGVMSIPKYMFGDYIQPNSISIITASGSYKDDGEGRLQRLNSDGSFIYVGNVIYEHGIIILTGGTRTEATNEMGAQYGNNEYGNGIYGGRTVGNNDIYNFVRDTNITCSFSSSYTIYETQYKCTIGESEFNVSQNPSITSGSDGALLNFTTESYFSPYITSVGLYNDQRDLLAVAKLSQPLATSTTTDTSILINLDRQ